MIGSLTVGFNRWGGFLAYGVSSWRSQMTNQNVKKSLRAWVRMGHGGPLAFASNVAIFLSGWVTCTAYSLPFGVSLWNTVCYRCISRRCYSYCIHSDRKVNINFFYLTLRYSVRIINVSRPVSSSSNQIETSCFSSS